jgi:hypothetical protein
MTDKLQESLAIQRALKLCQYVDGLRQSTNKQDRLKARIFFTIPAEGVLQVCKLFYIQCNGLNPKLMDTCIELRYSMTTEEILAKIEEHNKKKLKENQ